MSESPFSRKKYTSENKSKLKSLLGITLIIFMFTLWMLYIFLFIIGSFWVRIILLAIFIYQLLFIDQSNLYLKLLKWTKMYDYFKSYTVIFEEELSKEKHLLCSHPHGVLSFGTGMTLVYTDLLKSFIICGTRFVRMLPFSGIIARWVGIRGVNNSNFRKYMSKGQNICFVPGGFECATLTDHRQDKVFIKCRKGFIKYALQYGYKVHPCYTFNENKLFYTYNGFEKLGMLLNKLKFPGCFFIGKYIFFPRDDVDLCTVIGKPLDLPIIQNPTKEEINAYHELYIQSLISLFNKYKNEFGSSEHLVIL
jgi:hypothetical protein